MNKEILFPIITTLTALIVYIILFVKVAVARGKYGVHAPKISGHEDFERYFRVQQNTLEQLVLFLPTLWIFALLVSPFWAGIVGMLWPIGRIIYASAYYKKAEARTPGFVITFLPSAVFLIGSVVRIIQLLLS